MALGLHNVPHRTPGLRDCKEALIPMRSRSGALETDERDGRDGPGKTLEGEVPHDLGLDEVLDRRHHALGREHLARARLAAQAECEVRHAPDRAIVPPALEADRTDRGESLREPEADVQIVAALAP